jgi:hypothetical protein
MKEAPKEIIIQNAQAYDLLAAVLRANAEYTLDFRIPTDKQMMLVLYVDSAPTNFRVHLSTTGQWSLITPVSPYAVIGGEK